MAGPKTAGRLLANKTFANYHAQIKRLLKYYKRAEANEANDADLLLPNFNWTKLLQPARDALAAHIARKDNPHLETMTTINSYTAAQIEAMIKLKVPNSIVPISSYGIVDELSDAQINAAWSASGFVLNCTRNINVILSGTPYAMQGGSINLRNVDASPANKVFNVFVRARFGLISYEARTDSPPESVSIMYIGTVTTNASGISSTAFKAVTRIDTFRLSTAPLGSVIPVSGGTIDAPVKFPASWNPL